MDGEEIEELTSTEMEDLELAISLEESAPDKIEQAIITMCAPNCLKNTKPMEYKGQIGQILICTLIDSGGTYSFINPTIIHNLSLVTTKNIPLTVNTASGTRMSTDELCEDLEFQLQNHKFTGDLRVLDVQGYDLILGMDWLSTFGPMEIDWSKGLMTLKNKDKKVMLQVAPVTAEVRLCEQELDLVKEHKQGSQVILAHLFCTEAEEESQMQPTYYTIQRVLEEYQDVFAEPTSLPPSRPIDHQIPLKLDSKPINIRPYRFSYFQKLEIENLWKNYLRFPSYNLQLVLMLHQFF